MPDARSIFDRLRGEMAWHADEGAVVPDEMFGADVPSEDAYRAGFQAGIAEAIRVVGQIARQTGPVVRCFPRPVPTDASGEEHQADG